MDLKSRVGTVSSRHSERADAARVAAFRAAVGARGPGTEVPPTFMTACRRGEFELIQSLGVPLSRVLHAEQEYQYREAIRPGDTLTYETRLAQALEKKGGSGSMSFLTFETEVGIERAGASGLSAGLSRTTIVVRG